MTDHIFDASWTPPTPQSVVAAGGQGVARYLSSDPTKNLTRVEMAGYAQAGLTVVIVWEQGQQGPWRGGYPVGVADGREARRQADILGFDRTAVIYMALDDPNPAPAGAYPIIDAYARGFGEQWGSPALCGGYGSDGAIEHVTGRGHIRYGWVVQTWGADADDQLMQMVNWRDLASPSGSTDENRVLSADYGQWPRPAAGKPPPPLVVPAPIRQLHGDEMLVTVAVPTDPHGNGWADTGIPWAKFTGACTLQGPYPPSDGYWPGEAKPTDHDNKVCVAVIGALTNTVVNVFVGSAP